ncbi:S24 family peptidase [Burkholderia sp. LMG 13014]|uniref:XRE family transcriptional regulator n=1 Tax=Burkholderia sp. LMG 13014 TaxID=2709306 RepID=UPI001964012E|nr:S24 family peptidase [Burkholderia sp. LMG 13014]
MSIGTRIREVRTELELSQPALAARAGVSQGTISQLENNPLQSSKYLPAIARALGVSVDWLSTGIGERGRTKKIAVLPGETGDFIAIRKVNFRISAGVSGFAVEFLDDGDGAPLFFQSRWFSQRGFDPNLLYAAKVGGDSMEPTLKSGDVIVVNTGDVEPRDGEAFAVNYEGEFVVKRLIRDSGEWWLSSDNIDSRRFPRKRCHENTFILGRIVHAQTERI